MFSFKSSGKKKNTKGAQLRKKEARIKKIEKKLALESALKKADARLKQLMKR